MNRRKALAVTGVFVLTVALLLLPYYMQETSAAGVPTDPTLYHFDLFPYSLLDPTVGSGWLGLWPHEIQGNEYEIECWIDSNRTYMIDPCDEIALYSFLEANKTWYHVEYITVTINVTLGGDPLWWMALEFNGTKNEYLAWPDPMKVGSQWHAIKGTLPNSTFCNWFHLNESLLDSPPTGLSYCDMITMYLKNATTGAPIGSTDIYHVEWVTTNLILKREVWVPATFPATQFNGTIQTGTYFEVEGVGPYFEDFQQYQCQEFSVPIWIKNAPPTYAWELKFGWNNTVLKLINVTWGPWLSLGGLQPTLPTATPVGTANTQGWMGISETIAAPVPPGVPAAGSGLLCTVWFHVKEDGRSWLNLWDTGLLAWPGLVRTDYPNNDGFFCSEASKPCLDDIAVLSVVVNATSVNQGDVIQINVTTMNQGQHAETFDLYVHADYRDVYAAGDPDVTKIDELRLGPTPVALGIGAITTTTIPWDTSAFAGELWTISAEAVLTGGAVEDDAHDNIRIDSTVLVTSTNDIKITGITVLTNNDYYGTPLGPGFVAKGQKPVIKVTVKNEGTSVANFNVDFKVNGVTADTKSYSGLAVGASTTLTSNKWATWVAGTYTISAYATLTSAVEEAKNLEDNQLTDGTVTVIAIHDLAVSVTGVSPTHVATYGWMWATTNSTWYIKFIVEVKNEGTEPENYTLAVYADAINAMQSLVRYNDSVPVTQPLFLANGTSIKLVSVWITGSCVPISYTNRFNVTITDLYGAAEGRYEISATVEKVPSEPAELDTKDNRAIFNLPIVIKVIPGDVNRNGAVTGADVIKASLYIGEVHPPPP